MVVHAVTRRKLDLPLTSILIHIEDVECSWQNFNGSDYASFSGVHMFLAHFRTKLPAFCKISGLSDQSLSDASGIARETRRSANHIRYIR